jgi:hypothetical protein
MAAQMTYDTLVNDVRTYLERTDQSTLEKIPTFIMLAESIISDELKILGQQQAVLSTLVVGDPVIPKPARWRKTTSMNITVNGEKKPVLLRKYEYLRNYWPDPTQTGEPKYYADYNFNNWLIAPTPAAA